MTARYYFGDDRLETGKTIRLSPEESHHLLKVMRGRVGDQVIVFGGGTQFSATVVDVEGKNSAILSVKERIGSFVPVMRAQMTFVVPWIKGGKTDLVVQKLTELGAVRTIIFQAQREVARGDAAKVDRLQRIALEACKQCERADVPEIVMAGSLSDAIDLCDDVRADSRFVLNERDDRNAFSKLVAPALAESALVLFASGPEGGWHPDELQSVAGKVTPVSLGMRILRAETAPIVAAAAALALAGEI